MLAYGLGYPQASNPINWKPWTQKPNLRIPPQTLNHHDEQKKENYNE